MRVQNKFKICRPCIIIYSSDIECYSNSYSDRDIDNYSDSDSDSNSDSYRDWIWFNLYLGCK